MHPGSIESLSLFSGLVEITVDKESQVLKPGETLRYRGDLPHKLVNISEESAHATMVNILKSTITA